MSKDFSCYATFSRRNLLLSKISIIGWQQNFLCNFWETLWTENLLLSREEHNTNGNDWWMLDQGSSVWQPLIFKVEQQFVSIFASRDRWENEGSVYSVCFSLWFFLFYCDFRCRLMSISAAWAHPIDEDGQWFTSVLLIQWVRVYGNKTDVTGIVHKYQREVEDFPKEKSDFSRMFFKTISQKNFQNVGK